MPKNKYQSTIEIEFRDLIEHIVLSKRKSFHLYTIHRLLSLGLLLDYSFRYTEVGKENHIGIEMSLGENKNVLFIVDTLSSYVSFDKEESKSTLKCFLEEFDRGLKRKGKKHKIF